MTREEQVGRVKTARLVAILALLVVWIVMVLTEGTPKHPIAYDAAKHVLVAETVVQEPNQDDYVEYNTVAVWQDPQSGAFYSIYDPAFEQVIDGSNRRRTLLNYGFAISIALVVSLAHWWLHRRGVRPTWSTDASYRFRQRLVSAPAVFCIVAVACALGVAFGVHEILVSRVRRTVVVGAVIHDEAAHARFLRTDSDAVHEWLRDLGKSLSVIRRENER